MTSYDNHEKLRAEEELEKLLRHDSVCFVSSFSASNSELCLALVAKRAQQIYCLFDLAFDIAEHMCESLRLVARLVSPSARA
jgi:hypothetical protein